MWPLPVLFLLIIQGHFSKCQDGVVRGTAKGTLTTYCMYGQGWESYNKWWCRGENWMSCKILVKTTGSEQLVKKGRASIQDNASQRKFTMTLEDLRYDDAGTYWCGIERIGSDLGSKFSVIIDPVSICKYASSMPEGNGMGILLASKSLHFVLLTFVKVPRLGVLLWTVVGLSQGQRDPGREQSQSEQENHSSHDTDAPVP
uniref:Immunoglobulin V-set domain-containing protein n=1 Tax=Mustela putorius furo TaxID=9669 RepID=M3YRX2_MUSPF